MVSDIYWSSKPLIYLIHQIFLGLTLIIDPFVFFCSLEEVKIYFHAPQQFLDISGRMGHKMFKGKQVYTKVNYLDLHQLEKTLNDDQKSCSKESYNKCMYSMLSTWMKNKTEDGCTVPWILDDKKICTKQNDIDTAFWIYWKRVTNQQKDCLTPCHQLLIDVGPKDVQPLKDDSTGKVLIYFPPRLLKSTERYLYTILTLLAEIGGYMGLLLGYSLFNFATLVNELLDVHIEKEKEKDNKGEDNTRELVKYIQKDN